MAARLAAVNGHYAITVESSIQVGLCGPTVWVKVEGKGSFLNSENLKEFACGMLDHGYRQFVVDLADCATMDSTFMGTMAKVALRLKELGRGHFHIVHCGSRNQELLWGWVWTGYLILMLMAAVPLNVALSSKPLRNNRVTSEKRSRRRRCWKRMKRCARLRRKMSFALRAFSIS